MIEAALTEAVELAHHHASAILVATVDPNGIPHVSAAGEIALSHDRSVNVAEWFCPGMVDNIRQGCRNVSIVVWNPDADTGLQLVCQVVRMDDIAVMDGYDAAEPSLPMPQVRRRLVLRVEKVLHFCRSPHSDEEI